MYLCRIKYGHWFLVVPPIKIHHLNMVVLYNFNSDNENVAEVGTMCVSEPQSAPSTFTLLEHCSWLYQVQKQSLAHRADHMEDGLANNQYQLSAAAVSLTPGKATERMRSLSPAQVAKLESHEKHSCFDH